MKFLSICSGIEAASVAWHPLGWQPVGFSEIEPFPSAVLAHHWPDVPNLGDMTKHHDWPNTIRPELIVGGTPCQAFSVAGLRKGLADPRGNLTLTFLSILEQYRPTWVVWENVPGVLSEKTGAFGAFLGGLGELGYGFAYRVLDAQYFGVAQRRRRVFVVGHLGDWKRAAAVLFERESLSGDSPPSRHTGKRTATGSQASPQPFFLDRAAFNQGINAQYDPVIRQDGIADSLVARGPHAVAARMVAFGEYVEDGTASTMKSRDHKDATDLVTYGIPGNWIGRSPENGGNATEPMNEISPCLTKADKHAVAFRTSGNCGAWDTGQRIDALTTGTDRTSHLVATTAVRRLTPTECERLQGFPDGHTLIPWRGKPADQCPDGPRYKALGNSMAVPVMRWIGERINLISNL